MRTTLAATLGLAVAFLASTGAASGEVTIPKGTYLEVKSDTPFDSETIKRGDTFTAHAARGLWVEGKLAVPAGSTIVCEVKTVHSTRDGSKSGAMSIKFETLKTGGNTYDIEGILTSLKNEERRKMLDEGGKIGTGRHIQVILIGSGTEGDMKADTLVGISGTGREELTDDWAKTGLGPGRVHVNSGTQLTMQFDKTIVVAGGTGARGPDDRNIYTSDGTIKAVQRVLKDRQFYSGEVTGMLDQPTRDALARFQLDQSQPATGDADEATVRALGVTTASR